MKRCRVSFLFNAAVTSFISSTLNFSYFNPQSEVWVYCRGKKSASFLPGLMRREKKKRAGKRAKRIIKLLMFDLAALNLNLSFTSIQLIDWKKIKFEKKAANQTEENKLKIKLAAVFSSLLLVKSWKRCRVSNAANFISIKASNLNCS